MKTPQQLIAEHNRSFVGDLGERPLVLCRNQQQFADWCRSSGVQPSRAFSLTTTRALWGIVPTSIVHLPNWYLDRRDVVEISQCVKAIRFKTKPPLPEHYVLEGYYLAGDAARDMADALIPS